MTMTLSMGINKYLSTDTIRRVIIGAVLGFILIGIWMLVMPNKASEPISSLAFDSEIVALPSIIAGVAQGEDQIPSPPPVEKHKDDGIAPRQNDENARYYPFFAMFKAPVTQAQQEAIASGSPMLSVILANTGTNRKLNEQIIAKLSNNVTLSMSPYASMHNEAAEKFSDYGFEIWMDLAAITLEMNYDHGNLALNPVNNFERNIDLLTRQLDNKDKITGVVLAPQSLIVETQNLWADLVSDLFAEGYGVLDNTTQVMKPALFFHDDRRAPYLKGDQTLPSTLMLGQFKDSLDNIRKSAKEQGHLIVTIPLTTPAALDILANWVNSLKDDGITLVPVSAQVKL